MTERLNSRVDDRAIHAATPPLGSCHLDPTKPSETEAMEGTVLWRGLAMGPLNPEILSSE